MEETDRATLQALIEQFHAGMLVTHAPEGLRARPMTVAKLEDDNDLFFVTSVDSGKVAEIEAHHEVAITFQSMTAFVTLTGPARVVSDRARIYEVWAEPMRVWFPHGPSDPSICLVQLRPAYAEYWNMQGGKGLRYLFDAAKAYVTGTTPPVRPDQHGEVPLVVGRS
jgi:general stress protein 26